MIKPAQIEGELDGLLSGYLRRQRLRAAKPFVENSRSVLDVGCGLCQWQGILSESCEYYGVDIEPAITQTNREHCQNPLWTFATRNFEQNDTPDDIPEDHFDTVVMLAVIEHFADPEAIMQKVIHYLKPGGRIVLTTPAAWADIILDTGARFGLFAKDKHQHHDLLGKKEIFRLAGNCALEVRRFRRFLFFQNQLVILEKR